jgi:hypothetical protein
VTKTARLDDTGLQVGDEHWSFSTRVDPEMDLSALDSPPGITLKLGPDTPALLVARAAVTVTLHGLQLCVVP